MSDEPRITRPHLEVDRARRQPAALFASAGARPPKEEAHRSGVPDAPPGFDAISRGVELGYRVIDEYVRQGSNLARSWSARALHPNGARSDTRELSERMFQYAAEAASIWLELLGTTGGPPPSPVMPDARDAGLGTRAPAAPPAGEAQPVPTASVVSTPALAVALDSARPVEVTVRLHDPVSQRPLRVHQLRTEPGEPRLSDVRIDADPSGRPQRIAIRVEDSLPAGTYNGLIIDEATGRPAGTLSVTVLPGRAT